MMKAIEKLNEISKALAASGIEAAEKEAELFLRYGLDIDHVWLYRDNPELKDEQLAAVDSMVDRRRKREPLQYILGCADFLGLKILVGKGVLIPRPETELMAEYAIKTIKSCKSHVPGKNGDSSPVTDYSSRYILDLCTGSGCLALAIAHEFSDVRVYGTDISVSAIEYATKNAALNGIGNAEFMSGHLFEPLEKHLRFDFIVSNPPYISTDAIKDLQPEIRDWEPLNALDGGPDGLIFYREIITASRKFLKDNGILMLELGEGGAHPVHAVFKRAGYSDIKITKDYSDNERIIHGRWIR